jgi:hypothetical protein
MVLVMMIDTHENGEHSSAVPTRSNEMGMGKIIKNHDK